MKETFCDVLATNLRAGTPIMVVNTDEESRCVSEIRRAAWKSCNNMTIELEKKELAELKTIFSKHMPDLLPMLEANAGLRCDADKMIALLDKLGKLLEKDPNTAGEIAENQRLVEEVLNRACTVVCWDQISGFSGSKEADCAGALDEALLKTVSPESFPSNCVFVFKDCHHYLNNQETPSYRRIVRNIFEGGLLTNMTQGQEIRRHIIFVQPDWQIHRDLQGCLTLLSFDLPDEDHLEKEITLAELSVDDKSKTCPNELRSQICLALRGFTQMEAANSLAYCIAKHGGFVPEMVKTIRRLKKMTFQKNAVLDLVDDDDIASVDQIGGFENAIEFAQECKMCWTPEARKLNLKRPKGCLLLGIPGTGKTLFGKVLARIMELPLVIYDVAAQFGGIVGQTEATTRQTLAQIKAMGPCVVLIDEADKLFSGIVNGYQGDSGVAQRMLSRLLSFMSHENEEAFVVLTMNRTLGVPPEMLRAGRLDALFYTTFPTPRERLDILGIHMRKNGADIDAISKNRWDELVKFTDRYVGAELEQLVIKAVRAAFKNRRTLTPTFEELIAAKKIITPVAQLDKESITHMDSYCKDTAVPVSKAEAESKIFVARPGPRQIRTGPSSN
jgi:ATP-dependent 26S proteasome regulatory subunit